MSSNKFEHQAFPHGNQTHGGCLGMTLRDYFAGQVIAGLGAPVVTSGRAGVSSRFNSDDIAASAYRMADAMLKAREEE